MGVNRFRSRDWQGRHLKDIKQRAGSRYTPELNVDLPIAELFEGISRTDKFYVAIRTRYGRLIRNFSRVHGARGGKKAQRIYLRLQACIEELSKTIRGIQHYDTKKIPWPEVRSLAAKATRLSYPLSSALREAREKVKDDKKSQTNDALRSPSEMIGHDLHYLHETTRELEELETFALSDAAQLSNRPYLCLRGVAGAGKTHLMCDIVKNRYSAEIPLPSVLVFGELFEPSVDPVCTIARLAGVSLPEDDFLMLLDNAGRQSQSRAGHISRVLRFWFEKRGIHGNHTHCTWTSRSDS